jgi:hypothetical protein
MEEGLIYRWKWGEFCEEKLIKKNFCGPMESDGGGEW